MNDNNDPQSNAAFNTNTSPDSQANTNPFTGDLKGEFSSDFGTNTNAVSQIFKSGSFSSENRSKFIMLGLLLLAAVGGIAFFLSSDGESPFEDDFADSPEGLPGDASDLDEEFVDGEEEFGEEEEGEEGFEGEEAFEGEEEGEMAEEMEEEMPMSSSSTGSFTLLSPGDGARRTYDETAAAAEFTWEGAADRINLSRSPSMEPLLKSVPLNGATFYAFENAYPGTWYWQVVNADGASEVRMFRISSPERRSFPISQPRDGGSLSGSGGVVSWQAGQRIARYSVELVNSGGSWTQPLYRFGTSGTSVAVRDVDAGSYDMRVGAFSEVSGRWEWQYIRNVTVQ